MSDEEWARQENDTKDFFDSLSDAELMQVISDGAKVPDILHSMEYLFEIRYLQKYPNNKCLFNVWNEYELEEYLKNRFDCLRFREICYDVVRFFKPWPEIK